MVDIVSHGIATVTKWRCSRDRPRCRGEQFPLHKLLFRSLRWKRNDAEWCSTDPGIVWQWYRYPRKPISSCVYCLRIACNKYTLQATYCKIIIECNDALRGMYRGRYIWNSWLRARYCKVLVLQGIGDTELQALHRTGAGVAAQAWQAVTHREATARGGRCLFFLTMRFFNDAMFSNS